MMRPFSYLVALLAMLPRAIAAIRRNSSEDVAEAIADWTATTTDPRFREALSSVTRAVTAPKAPRESLARPFLYLAILIALLVPTLPRAIAAARLLSPESTHAPR